MKRFPLILLAIGALSFASCNPSEDDKGEEVTVVKVGDSTLTLDGEATVILPAKGGIYSIGYTISNPAPDGYVDASADADWITEVNVTNSAVSFKFSDNEVFDVDRDATLTVTYKSMSETGPSKNVSIKQLSNARPEPVLTVDTKTVSVPREGGEFAIEYTLEWPVDGIEVTATTEAEWIKDIAVGEESITFKAEANNTLDELSAVIKVAYANLSEEVPVKQAAAPTPVLTVDQTPFEVSEDEYSGSIAYSIENPLEILQLVAVADVDWITDFQTGETAVSFKVLENTVAEEREGIITISYNNEKKTVSVKQAAASAYAVFKTTGWNWKEGDIVTVQLISAADASTYDMWKFKARNDGEGAKLDIVDGDTWTGIADNWMFGQFAFFPKETSGAITYNKAANTISLAGTIAAVPDDPESVMPVIGYREEESSVFDFKAAAGFVKISVSNIPETAGYAALTTAESGTYALNGSFSFDSSCEIKEENVVGTKWGEKYIYFTAPSSGAMDFYFPIPTGTIPAGLKFQILDAATASVALGEYTAEEAIEVKAGETVELPALQLPAYEWTSIGQGWFGDNYLFAQASFGKAGCMAPVEIERNDNNPSMYRVLYPYKAAASKLGVTLGGSNDPYLVFTVDGESVRFEKYKSGVLFSNATYPNCNTSLEDLSSENNAVVLDGSSPKLVTLSPKYWIESASGEGDFSVTLSDRSAYKNIINIVFPGYSVAEALAGNWGINGVTNYITLGAISDGDYNVAITHYYHTALELDGLCKGTYDPSAGTLVFPMLQSFADTGDVWDGASYSGTAIVYSFRCYSNSDGAVDLSFYIDNVNGYWNTTANKFCLDKYVSGYIEAENPASGYLSFHQYTLNQGNGVYPLQKL